MRRLLAGCLLALALVPAGTARAEGYPQPDGYVLDTADVLTDAQEQRIEGELDAYDRATTNQVAVAVVPSLEGQSVEEYAHGLFEQWGIGMAQTDNGVLLLLAIGDRASRIQVGLGLESLLTPEASQRVLDEVVAPAARRRDYAGAVLGAEREIQRLLGTRDLPAPEAPVDSSGDPFGGGVPAGDFGQGRPATGPPTGPGLGGLLVVGLVVLVTVLGGAGRMLGGGYGGPYRRRGYGGGLGGLGTGLLLGSALGGRRSTWSGGSSGGDFGGGGGGMGGSWGGGFGGGSSGGGGASGGW